MAIGIIDLGTSSLNGTRCEPAPPCAVVHARAGMPVCEDKGERQSWLELKKE